MLARRLLLRAMALAAFAGCVALPALPATVTTVPVGWPIPVSHPRRLIAAPDGVLVLEPTSASVSDFEPATLSRVTSRGELPSLVVLAEAMSDITVAGAELFWIGDLKPARIRAGALAKPAAARTLTTEPEGVEFGLAVDDTQVYYARRDDAIMRVPRAGGACETVTTAGGRVIGVAGGALYFFTRTEVRRIPVAGGASTVVLPATSTVQAWVDGPELIVHTKPSSDGALDGTLLSLPLSGGPPRTLLSDLGGGDATFLQVSFTPTKIVVLLPFRSSSSSFSPDLAIISRADGRVVRRHPFHDYPLQVAASEGALYYGANDLLQREDLPQ